MFKLFFVYPLIAFICVWLASDVIVGASVYAFEDNHLSLEFPKESLREAGTDPWFEFYWNASSSRNEIIDIKDAVTH